MNHRRHKAGIAALASLLIPGISLLPLTPTAQAATVLFAEGATRQTGEAQTAFNGAFCEQNPCRSLGRGTVTRKITSQQIQAAVDSTPGELILVGYSVGGAGIYDRLRVWERNPALAPDPARIKLIVTFGNPENKFGGENRNQTDVGLPTVQPYEHLDVVAQYDGVADNPARFGFYSFINSAVFSRHFAYFDGLDINDPENLVIQEGNTTYMLIPAKTLPMLRWIEPFVTEERLAELDARYRPLVERDYDRPAYVPQGEGADWGNGNPPPSLREPEPVVEAQLVADESDTPTTVSESGEEPAVTRTSRSAAALDDDEADETEAQLDVEEAADAPEDTAAVDEADDDAADDSVTDRAADDADDSSSASEAAA